MQGTNEHPAVLVTGGAGYIGSHTCKALAAAGYLPLAYDNLVTGHEWAVQWGPLECGDLHDNQRLAEVVERHRPVAAIHFAAHAYVGESVRDPAKYYDNNVAGTLSLLAALRAGGVDRLVFSSSCATYGSSDRLPITEDHPQRPLNPYGHSKRMIEQILADYDHAYGLRSIALRYFNVAGADPDGDIGEDHEPETHLIPLAIETALGRRGPLEIFGDDYPTPDGTAIRDYIHVVDLARAHVLALQLLERGSLRHRGRLACNLGTGHGYSVREIVSAVERVTGRAVATRIAARRPGDPAALIAAPDHARALLGWQAHCSNLESIVDSASHWIRIRDSRRASKSRAGAP